MADLHDFDFDETDLIKGGYIKKFLLYPEFWLKPENQIAFNLNWKRYKFLSRNKRFISKEKGIYCFVIEPNVQEFFNTRYLFYIGKTNGTLQSRYGNYIDELKGIRKSRVKIKNMLKKYDGHIYYYFTPIDTKDRVNEVEDKLINTFLPHANVQIPIAKIKPEYRYIYE
ncbi:GIY-YIG nuclease family protein [bacterium AH-315-A23]|nr:GIY-YIG nuclease family protein [bacterium AH-315-A23]